MARVFVSHSSRDNKVAAELKAWLASQGFDNVFLDFDKHAGKGIPPGADWERKLYQEIDSSHAVILILTPNWLDSKWCFVEFAQARALGKAIFPVIVPPGGERLLAPDIQHLDLRSDHQGGLARLAQELTELALNTQGGFEWDVQRPPYPGLLSFETEDAAIFFGRDDDIRRLIERLNARRVQGGPKLVAVLGASGSGKSSLLRAGVLPRLARDKRNWVVLPPFRPRLDPIGELARAVTEELGRLEEWRGWGDRLTSENCAAELQAIAEALRMRAGAREAQILVTMDQAEEIFTVTPKSEAQQFWQLFKTATEESSAFITVMALRSDYLGTLQKAAEGVVRFEEFSLGPMPLERVQQIIEGPARVAGLKVEEGLISAAVADAGTEDALPLLAFTLRELYDRYAAKRDGAGGRQLLRAHYRALGDPIADLNPLENSVRKRADELIETINPTPEELETLRKSFVGPLVRVNDKGEYVRHPARWNDLPVKAQPLLQKLTDARLLVTRDVGGEKMVEVAHEALLRKWPRLRAWLDEEQEFLIGKARLEAALADWRKAPDDKKPGALLQGLLLDRASQWLLDHPHALSDDEETFIKLSQAQARAERQRRRRIRAALIGAGALVLALVGGGLVWAKFEAARREALQRGVDATRLAFLSGRYLRENDVASAVKTALKAEDTLSTPETRSALLQSLLAISPHLSRSLSVKDLQPFFLAVEQGGADVLIGGFNGAIESWQPGGGEVSRAVTTLKPRDPNSPIAPALRVLATTKNQGALALLDDGRVVSFDQGDGHELAKPAQLAEDIGKAAIGEDGLWIVAASETAGEVSAFSCRAKGSLEPDLECAGMTLAKGFADAVAVSDKAALAAVALEQGGLSLIRLDQTPPTSETIDLPNNPRIRSLAFDATGERLAVGTMTGDMFVIELPGGHVALPAQLSAVTALAFNRTSTRLATSCDGFAICIWQLPDASGSAPSLQAKLDGHTNTVLAVAFGPGSDEIVSVGADDAIKAWTIDKVDHVSFALVAPNRQEFSDLGVSVDRRWLAAGNAEGGIALFDLKSLAFARELPPLRAAEIRALQWHPNKPILVQSDKMGFVAIRSWEEQEPDQIKLDKNGNTIDAVRWLPGGHAVAAGLFAGEIAEWHPGDEPVAFNAKHPDAVQGLAVDPKSNRLYSTDSFGNLWAWNLETRNKLSELPSVGAAQDVVDLTDEGRAALTAGNGGKVSLYDLEEMRILRQLEIGVQAEGAGFSRNAKLIAAVDNEARLHIWSLPDGPRGESEVFATVKVYPDELLGQASHATHLRRLTWLPELSAMAIATSRGEVKIISYDVPAWRQRARMTFSRK